MQKSIVAMLVVLVLTVSTISAQTGPEIIASTDESLLIGVVKKAERDDATLYLINLACKRLGTHGTKEAVPALAAMLGDEKVAHYARYALEEIPAPEVDGALRDALKTLQGDLLAGVINSLGVRRDAVSMTAVSQLLADGDNTVAVTRSAIGFFGYVGTPEAADCLISLKVAIPLENVQADALFECAQQLRSAGNNGKALEVYAAIAKLDTPQYQKNAAIYWSIKTLGATDLDAAVTLLVDQLSTDDAKFAVALKAARELPAGEKVTKAMIDELGKLPVARQMLWIAAIGDRTDDASKMLSVPVLGSLLKSNDKVIKIAAIKALARSGNASVLPALIAAATDVDQEIAAAAHDTLVAIPGKMVDTAIVTLLDTGDLAQKNMAITLIEQRRIVSAFEKLRKAMRDKGTSKAAVEALGQVATLDDLPFLLDQLKAAQSPEENDTIKKVLMSAVTRMPKDDTATIVTPRIDTSDIGMAAFLIDLLKEIGGTKAVDAVVVHAWGNSEPLKDKATEVLGAWRSPEDNELIAAACLKLAKEATENKYKLRGLRGYIRLPRQSGAIAEDRKLEMVKQYMDLAVRQEDKLLAFDVFARNPSPKMLAAAVAYLDDATLKEKAAETVIVVAEKIQGKSSDTAAAVKKAAEATTNDALKNRANIVMEKQR